MATIVVASSKGGAGKTTLAALLGSTAASRGASVTIIDADDNQPLVTWHQDAQRPFDVLSGTDEGSFVSLVDREAAAKDLVLIDLEGAATRIMSRAIMRADLVLIPMQPSRLDAVQAGRTVGLVKQEEEILRQAIPCRVCMTRTGVAVQTRTTKAILSQMAERGIPALRTHLHERVPFRVIWEQRCTLAELNPGEVSGVAQALENAAAFTDEVLELVRTIVSGRAAA